MLLIEIFGIKSISSQKSPTKKVQPVKRIVKADVEPDVKKKPVPKGRIDTYA
jgi:hypothetical protein